MTRLSRPTRERFFNSNQRVHVFCRRCTIFYSRFYVLFFFLPFFPPFYYYRDISIGSSSKIDRNGEQFAALCTYTRFARFVPDNVSLLYLSLENKITRRIVATGLDTIFSNKAFRIHIYIYIYKCKHYHSRLTTNHVFLLI